MQLVFFCLSMFIMLTYFYFDMELVIVTGIVICAIGIGICNWCIIGIDVM